VSANRKWSTSSQNKLASMLGMSAVTALAGAALTACDTTSATSGDVVEEVSSSSEQASCSGKPCDWVYDESSSSVAPSSSSFLRIESSSTTSGLPFSSSDAVLPSSSSTESGPLAGDPIVTEPVVEPGPMLSGVIEDTPVHVDEPKQ